MTYIFEMASGTEYLGDEMQCPESSARPAADAPAAYDNHQVELRLAVVETESFAQKSVDLAHGLDLAALIDALDD